MKPAPFEYFAPTSIPDALVLMEQYGYDAKLLAGGQSLLPVMNFRLAQPAVLVDLNGIAELGALPRLEPDGLHVGAMVRQSHLERSQIIAATLPLLHETMPHIAHPQIRNRGTLGGSLAHADPAAELPVISVALEARFRLQQANGERWIKAEDFYQSLFTTALQPDEILTEVVIPPPEAHTGCAFLELARRHGDYAQAGVAALVTLDESGACRRARLVYLNVGEIPMVARQAAAMLAGEKPAPALLDEAARHATGNEIDPADDVQGTAVYKRHLAYVLGKRALEQAVIRAQSTLPGS
ncbi:MAG: xanthine dehydrogenase family protein subunit M [Anaerolineales bacterium]|nr:xanthine dehydrogenase family protein subunit M [Anaerolineales bacterium]